jgi:CHAT domain-containing protein/Tfp pilus assembly protein PilF
LQKRDQVLAWKFRVLHAQALSRQRKPADSLAILDIPPPANLPNDVLAMVNIARSHALCNLSRISEGIALLDKTERLVDRSAILQSQVQYALGDCSSSQNANGAAAFFREAAALAHGRDSYLESKAFVYLGYVLMEAGRSDQAIGFFNQALSITDSPMLKQLALGNIGYCHERLGDWKTSLDYLQRAEQLASTVKDAASFHALWLVDIGQQYYSQLQYGEAEQAWNKGLSIAQQLKDPARTAQCFNNLAVLALRRGDPGSAEQYVQQTKNLAISEEQRLYLVLTEAKIAKFRGNPARAEELMLQILVSQPDTPTRYNTETELATLYADQGRINEADKMFRDGISTAEKAFDLVSSENFRISFMDYEPFYDRYVNFLVNQNRPLEALSVAERARSGALAAALGFDRTKELQLSSIQSRLRSSGQIALAYWLAQKESYLWVITPSETKLLKLAPEPEIVKAVDGYGQEVLDVSTAQESRLGQKLYQMLVAPAEKYIRRGSQIIIVPHRRLYKLNFETLVAPSPKPHFWIEDICIQNASFLAVLESRSRSTSRHTKDLLLMGAPVEVSKDFPGLEHAPEEIKKVAAHFPSSKEAVLHGPAATPIAYETSNPREFRFLHFVTHGTASDANPLDSAIILSPDKDGYKLYGHDIIKTKINPELVTISTCYGAGTRQYSGEGLVGLAWAFMRVGAHQVIAALWEVDDAANADLMDHFYAELTSGKNAAVALRDGKLAMLHSTGSRKRPYYWASLQLYSGP